MEENSRTEINNIVEKVNRDYLEVYQSQKYKLGDMLFGILEGIKTLNLKKSFASMDLLWQGIRIQKYTSKTERYKQPGKDFIAPRTAIYMALFGKYDEILEPVVTSANCDYYIFTDQKVDEHSAWKKVELTQEQNNNLAQMTGVEKNRFFKMLGYQQFSDYEYSIYIDTNMEIYYDLSKLDIYADIDSGIAMYNHPARGCIYNEAKVCVISGKANKKDVKVQMKKYRELGMPENYGMCECNVIVRKTASEQCRKLMHEWWTEFGKSCVKRDQIVFPYVLWKNGIDIHEIGCLGENVDHDGKFRRKMHV